MLYSLVIRLAVLFPALFETVNGHYGYYVLLCRELGSLENIEFIFSINFNKDELIRINSTENKVVGYTEYAMKWADDLNKKPEWLQKEMKTNVANCKHYGAQFLPLLEKSVKPKVTIRSVRQSSGKHPAMLICSAYDFYPKLIKMSWMRDDEVMTSDVSSTEELADGDWYYQIHSHLEYFPKPGEKITCVVEHASSNKPIIYHWDYLPSESQRNEIITGVAGFVLGMIMTVGGLIYYKRKHTAHVTAAAGQDIRFTQPLQTVVNTEEQ